MDSSNAAYNVDWIVSTASNVHVATNRDWFINFTPFKTAIDTGLVTNSIVGIEGIGDVELPLELSDEDSPYSADHIVTQRLILRDVLYTRESPANIIGFSILARYHRCRFEMNSDYSEIIDMGTRSRVAVVDNHVLYHLRLRGQRLGRSSLDHDTAYVIRAMWPEEERQRWQRFKAVKDEPKSPLTNRDSGSDALLPLSEQEKRFLKKHWKNEFNFLRDQGLKLMNDEDRSEGRQILKCLMERDVQEKEAHMKRTRADGQRREPSKSSTESRTSKNSKSERYGSEKRHSPVERHGLEERNRPEERHSPKESNDSEKRYEQARRVEKARREHRHALEKKHEEVQRVEVARREDRRALEKKHEEVQRMEVAQGEDRHILEKRHQEVQRVDPVRREDRHALEKKHEEVQGVEVARREDRHALEKRHQEVQRVDPVRREDRHALEKRREEAQRMEMARRDVAAANGLGLLESDPSKW